MCQSADGRESAPRLYFISTDTCTTKKFKTRYLPGNITVQLNILRRPKTLMYHPSRNKESCPAFMVGNPAV